MYYVTFLHRKKWSKKYHVLSNNLGRESVTLLQSAIKKHIIMIIVVVVVIAHFLCALPELCCCLTETSGHRLDKKRDNC